MKITSKRFQSFEILAEDILCNNFCNKNVTEEMKKSLLTQMLIDLYWEGWHDNASNKYAGE